MAMVVLVVTGCARAPARPTAPHDQRRHRRRRRGQRPAEHRPGRQPGRRAATCQGERRQGRRQDDDQPVGRRRGQRRGRPVPAPADGLHGRDHDARRGARRGRASIPARSTSSSRTGAIPTSRRTTSPTPSSRRTTGPNGVTGIIGWYVPGWMVDKYPDITDWHNLNKYADMFKTLRVRRQGPVPRQRPDVRPVRRGADHEPRPELQGRLLRQRGRDDQGLPGGRQEQDAADRLLLRPAVAPERDQARPDQAAALHAGLRRGPRRRSPATTRRTS